MRKAYEKPQIMFEDFSLNTSIAACGDHENVLPNSTTNGCGVDVGGGETIYSDTCTYPGDENVCYHPPTADSNLFGSV